MATNYPAPKLAAKGKASRHATATFIANPGLKGKNPREAGVHGWHFHEIVRKAGSAGITYADLKAAVTAHPTIKGFSNHLKWDMDRHYIVVKKD